MRWGRASERKGPGTTAGLDRVSAQVRVLACGVVVGVALAGVLVTSGPAGGQVTPAPSTVVSAVKAASPVGSPGEELVGRRSRTSRTYVSDDRRGLMTRVFSASVNYRDSGGSWRAIDNGLDLVDGAYRNRANRFDVRLPRRLAGGVVRVSDLDRSSPCEVAESGGLPGLWGGLGCSRRVYRTTTTGALAARSSAWACSSVGWVSFSKVLL